MDGAGAVSVVAGNARAGVQHRACSDVEFVRTLARQCIDKERTVNTLRHSLFSMWVGVPKTTGPEAPA